MPPDTTIDLLGLLHESRLLSPETLEAQVRPLKQQFPDPRALAKELVRRGLLTPFQANQVIAGRGRGLVVGPYTVLDRLGQGGMGQVFKARHQLMNRLVALKVLRPELLASETAAARFNREVQAAARLSHPNIVTAYDAVQAGNTNVLVMEFVEGTDLAGLVQKNGPLPGPLACDCVRQAALGLQHAHEQGLVHRDVKPANLLLAANGRVVKVLDLGLARLRREDGQASTALTAEGALMGTADYMAPEQALNFHDADTRADVYSLGCTLYHLLTGRPPFAGGTFAEKVIKHREIEPAPVEAVRSEVPRPLAEVLRRMMAKRPEDRYPTPGVTAAALQPFCRETSSQQALVIAELPPKDSGSFTQQGIPRPTPPRHRRWVFAALAGLAVTSAAMATALIVGMMAQNPPSTAQGKTAQAATTQPESEWELYFEDSFEDDASKNRPRTIGDALGGFGEKDGKHFIFREAGGPPGQAMFTPFGTSAADFIAEARLHYSGGTLFVWFRLLGETRRTQYLLGVDPDGTWTLRREWSRVDDRGKWTREKDEIVTRVDQPTAPVLKEKQWTDLRIEARGENVEIRADGKLFYQFRDPLRSEPDAMAAGPGLILGIAPFNNSPPVRLEVDRVRLWRLKTQ